MQRCLGCMKEYGKEYDVCPFCGYMTDTVPTDKNHLIPGTILADRYMLGRAIGHGGFGITYIAWDEKIQKKVAVKEYFPNAFSTRQEGITEVSFYNEKAERFFKEGMSKMLDEARKISRFSDNENIVDIYDYFEENNTAYIVMEYLEGEDLKKYLEKKGGKISPEHAVKIILPVLNALKDMHKEKLIHRDISPDNIYMCNNGKVKLLDFGAARLAVEDSEKSLSVMIKRGYAPKEQYISRSKQGPWTDVYAVCATMYRMITGEVPTESVERDEEPLKKFAEFGITGYEQLEETLFNGLEPNVQDRIQSVEMLERLLTGEKLVEQIASVPQNAEKKKNKKAIKVIAIILACVIVIGAILGVKFLSPEKKPNDETIVGNNDEIKAIDLITVDLSQYGISSNNEISEAFVTPKGNYYYVCDLEAETNDKFKTYRFFTTDEDVMYAEVEALVIDSYINPVEYVFYDINNDGAEELIVHEKIHVNDYRVFTFKDGEMLFAGAMFNDFGDLYGKDGTVTTVGREWLDEEGAGHHSFYCTYELVDNKLVEKESDSCEPLNGADDSQFGQKMVFTKWPEDETPKNEPVEEQDTTETTTEKVEYLSDYILKTDNWKSDGLKKYGLKNQKISKPVKSSAGNVYYVTAEPSEQIFGTETDGYLVLETSDKIFIEKTSEMTYGGYYIQAAELDGKKGDEVVVGEIIGGTAYRRLNTVWKVSDVGITKMFEMEQYEGLEGFTATLEEPYMLMIENDIGKPGTAVFLDSQAENLTHIFDDEGKLLDGEDSREVSLEDSGIYVSEVIDCNGDDIYEIVTKQPVGFMIKANCVGEAVRVFKYDSQKNTFVVVDAEFVGEESLYFY